MTDNIENATFEILKNIQASIGQLRAENNDRFGQLEKRLDQIDAGMRKDRRNVAGMLVMMRSVAGEFDERVTEIEERVAALENRAQ